MIVFSVTFLQSSQSMSRTERRGSRLSGAGNHDADERHRIDHLVFEVSFLHEQLLTI